MSNRKKSARKHTFPTRSGTSVSLALRLNALAGITLIVGAVFLAYLPSISGGFILDDDLLLTDNPNVAAPDGLCLLWCTNKSPEYYPASYTANWVEWRLWGTSPAGYHVTSLILHVAEALLIWIVLRKLSIPGAFLAALIFAVHPVNVESVAWIAQRRNIIAMFFFLLSILWYLKDVLPTSSTGMAPSHSLGRPREQEINHSLLATHHSPLSTLHSPLWYWLSLAAFVLAMLGKGSVAVMPALLLGIIWWLEPLMTGPQSAGTKQTWAVKMGLSPLIRRHLSRLSPFFAVAIALTVVNMWFQTYGEEVFIRKVGFADRLVGAGCVIWFYLYKALLPLDLAFVYPQWHIEAGKLLWWLPLVAALAVTAVLWRHRKGWSRPILFAWGFFCVALVPVLGFVDVGFMQFTLVADHYQHIAIIGAIALATAGWIVWRRLARGADRWTVTAVAAVAVGVFTFLTWLQCGIYRDPITLYKTALAKYPDCWLLYENLGCAFYDIGRPRESIKYHEHALHLKPDSVNAHFDLGKALLKSGRTQEAIDQFKKVLLLSPEHFKACNTLALAYAKTNQSSDAIEVAQKALNIARSKGSTKLAKQIEDWLNSYRANLPK